LDDDRFHELIEREGELRRVSEEMTILEHPRLSPKKLLPKDHGD